MAAAPSLSTVAPCLGSSPAAQAAIGDGPRGAGALQLAGLRPVVPVAVHPAQVPQTRDATAGEPWRRELKKQVVNHGIKLP